MKKLLLLILIAVLSVVSFGIVKYKEMLLVAASRATEQEVAQKREHMDAILVAELHKVGIEVDRLGDPPRKITDTPGQVTQTTVIARYYTIFTGFMADYKAEIDALFRAAKAEYLALPAAEQTADRKVRIGMDCVDRAAALELEADALAESMLKGLKEELEANHFGTHIVDQVREYYEQYKRVQKQYYLAKLREN